MVLFRAAFSLAFFGAFRISELVSQSRARVGGLLRADVQVSAEGLACLFLGVRPESAVALLVHRDGSFFIALPVFGSVS